MFQETKIIENRLTKHVKQNKKFYRNRETTSRKKSGGGGTEWRS